MKTFRVFLVFVVIVAFAAILTKPNDEQCIELIKSKINAGISNNSSNPIITGLGSVLVDMGVKKTFFRIEDKIFYKNVYLIIDGRHVGTCLFGTVIISKDSRNYY